MNEDLDWNGVVVWYYNRINPEDLLRLGVFRSARPDPAGVRGATGRGREQFHASTDADLPVQ